MDKLAEMIGQALDAIAEEGAGFPVLSAAVAVNGSMFYGQYAGDGGFTPFASHTVGDGFALPINIMMIDAGGEAYRIAITQDGMTVMH